jgi:SnoaL-like domain
MTVDHLWQLELIKQLKYRYIRAMDTHDWALMAACFTEDATFVPYGGKYQKQGRAEIVAFFDEVVKPSMVSSHTVSHPEIALTSATSAYGRWRLEDTIYFTEANPGVKGMEVTGGQLLRGAAYYYDEYELHPEGWQISRLNSIRIFTHLEPIAAGAQLTVDPSLGALTPWPANSSPRQGPKP